MELIIYVCSINLRLKMRLSMKKTTEFTKMVRGYHKEKCPSLKELFTQASEERRVEFRDAYLAFTGMSYPSFYQKLSENKFRPLEVYAFFEIMKTHPLIQ